MAKFRKKQGAITLDSVKSSTISAFGYDKIEEVLIVEFKGGAQYRYEKVPKATFDGLKSAESFGKYFHSTIKGKFTCTKIKKSEKELQKEAEEKNAGPQL